MGNLRQGMEHIERAVERAKSGGGDGPPLNFFKWEDKETKVLRFLLEADETFVLEMHEYVACHDGKRRGFVCREEVDGDCELCKRDDVRSSTKGWSIAALRTREGGEYVDYTEEFEDEDGNTKVRPWVGIVRQAPTNFWTYIQSIEAKKGSLKDYDLEIERKGDDKNTIYIIMPADRDPIENIDERYKNYMPDLAKMLESMASQEYYDRHLHGITPDDDDDGGSSPTSSDDSGDLDEETEFDRLKKQQEKLREQAAGDAYE